MKIEAESTFSAKIPRPKQIKNYEYDSLDQMKTYGVDYLEMGKFRIIAKADLGPARRARAPRFEKCFGLNFDCITCICVDFSQHAMFTICILFTSLLQKLRVCVKGH